MAERSDRPRRSPARELRRFVKKGGFFMTSDDHEQLLAREKPNYDGAEPSGNSIAVLNLLRLHEFTTATTRIANAPRKHCKPSSPSWHRPSRRALSEMLLAVDFHLDTAKQVIIVTSHRSRRSLAASRSTSERRSSLIVSSASCARRQGVCPARLTLSRCSIKSVPLRTNPPPTYARTVICKLPTSDPDTFARQLAQVQTIESPVMNLGHAQAVLRVAEQQAVHADFSNQPS